MRVCSYIVGSHASYGVLDEAGVRDAGSALATWPDLRTVLEAGALDRLAELADGDLFDPDDLSYLPPVANPPNILCVGMNYAAHVKEAGRELPTNPAIFTRTANSIVGHEQPILRPKASDWFDFEGELGVVIGRPIRHASLENALDAIAGYTIINDGSIRDYQRHTIQFWPGKSFYQSGSAGPFLVTPDEVGDPSQLSLQTRLNGQVMQQTSTSDLVFNVSQLIVYLSTITQLCPGDMIATGTPSGVGAFRDPRVWMKPGDRLEIEISKLGMLANPVAAEM